MQKGKPRLPAGTEIAAEAEMDSRKQAVPHIAAQILPAQPHYLRPFRFGRVGKQPHNRLRRKLGQHAHAQAETGCDDHRVAQRLPCPFCPARADVLRAQGGHRRQHGGRDQKQKADDLFHNAYGGRIVKPPAVGDHGNDKEGNLDKAVLQGNGNPDFQKLPHHERPGRKVLQAYGNPAFFLCDHCQGDSHAHSLGQRGPQGCARRSHMKTAHKQIVQPDIGRAGHRDKIHGAFGIPHPAENGTDNIIGRDKRNPQKADRQIGDGSRHRFLWRGNNGYNWIDKQKQNRCQDNGHPKKQGDRIPDTRGHGFSVARAHGLPDGNGGAHGQPHDHHRQHVHDLGSHRHRRGAGNPFKLPDDEQVRHPV